MLTDPMALVTDSALGIVAWILAARLWRVHRMWALAFVFVGVASFCGGAFHGFGDRQLLLWKATVIAVGIASFFLLAGTSRKLAVVATVKLVIYLSWMITHDAFVYVIADYGLTLLLVAIFNEEKKWALASIGTSIIGALVQLSGLTIHPRWFDHNDLYHFIQMAALWMLMKSATSRPTIRPT